MITVVLHIQYNDPWTSRQRSLAGGWLRSISLLCSTITKKQPIPHTLSLNRANYLFVAHSVDCWGIRSRFLLHDTTALLLRLTRHQPDTTCSDVLLCAADRDIIYLPIGVHQRVQGQHKSRSIKRHKFKALLPSSLVIPINSIYKLS